MEKIRLFMPIIIVLLLSYWSVAPLFYPGFYPMHDDTQVARVFEMHKSLSDGMFPVRWVQDLGYGFGYPIFNFYAPLAYYIGAVILFIGFNALAATKIMIGLGVLAAGVFMYLLAREFWGKMGGIISALLYIYAPYHALNIYVRGAVSELWAYGILPLIFYSVYKLFATIQSVANLETRSNLPAGKAGIKNSSYAKAQEDKQKSNIEFRIWLWVCVSALSYAAIILSHNLTAMMVTPFIFAFSGFLYIKLRRAERIYKPYFVFLGLLIGIMLAAFYWLPVPFEMKYTDVLSVVGGGSDYRDHFVCVTQFWNSPWGFAGSAPGCIDGFSLKIGKLHILLGLFSISSLFYLFKKEKTKFQLYVLFLIFLLLSFFLTLKVSQPIWDIVTPMAFFQFPWRFLVVIVFFVSFFGGGSVWVIDKFLSSKKYNKNITFPAFIFIAFMIIFLDAKVFEPQRTIDKTNSDYIDEQVIKWETSKISDEYMPPNFLKPINPKGVPDLRFVPNENVDIISIEEKTGEINAEIEASGAATLMVNLAYFPGWHVYIDDNQEWFKYSIEGMMINVPDGRHDVDIKFSQTPVEKAGNAVSVAGIIILLVGIIYNRRK